MTIFLEFTALAIISTVLFCRAANLAIGLRTNKFYKSESFGHSQLASAIFSLAGLALSLFQHGNIQYFWILFSLDIILNILLYLQPTPRIGRLLKRIFVALNLVICLLFVALVLFWKYQKVGIMSESKEDLMRKLFLVTVLLGLGIVLTGCQSSKETSSVDDAESAQIQDNTGSNIAAPPVPPVPTHAAK